MHPTHPCPPSLQTRDLPRQAKTIHFRVFTFRNLQKQAIANVPPLYSYQSQDMFKTIIIEDQTQLRHALVIMLEMVAGNQVQVIGYAENITDARALIDQQKPDLVFMDIMLKNGTAFDVLEHLEHRDFHLVFTTAYEQHAISAFKYNAVDYLLKPIDPEELKHTLQRISRLQNRMLQKSQLDTPSSFLTRTPDRIILPTQEAMYVVKPEQVIRCETSGSYTTFYVADGRKIMVSKPLKNYEEILSTEDFFRVHQSHLINIHYVNSYSREGMVKMTDGIEVPIARGKKEQFFKLMRQE